MVDVQCPNCESFAVWEDPAIKAWRCDSCDHGYWQPHAGRKLSPYSKEAVLKREAEARAKSNVVAEDRCVNTIHSNYVTDHRCQLRSGHEGDCLFGRATRNRVQEWCREDLPNGERCNKPAEFILWGKLFPKEGLGPRCYDHAAKHAGHRALSPSTVEQYAIYVLPRPS